MTKGFVFLQLHRSQFFGGGLNFNKKKEKVMIVWVISWF
jgi:hypothetical protein